MAQKKCNQNRIERKKQYKDSKINKTIKVTECSKIEEKDTMWILGKTTNKKKNFISLMQQTLLHKAANEEDVVMSLEDTEAF